MEQAGTLLAVVCRQYFNVWLQFTLHFKFQVQNNQLEQYKINESFFNCTVYTDICYTISRFRVIQKSYCFSPKTEVSFNLPGVILLVATGDWFCPLETWITLLIGIKVLGRSQNKKCIINILNQRRAFFPRVLKFRLCDCVTNEI